MIEVDAVIIRYSDLRDPSKGPRPGNFRGQTSDMEFDNAQVVVYIDSKGNDHIVKNKYKPQRA